MNPELIVRLHSSRKAEMSQELRHWETLAEYIMPASMGVYGDETVNPETRHRQIFDQSGPKESQKLAANLYSGLTPKTQSWFQLRFADDELNNNAAISKWLQDTSNKMQRRIRESNFYSIIQEVFQNIVVFAIATLGEEPLEGSVPGDLKGLVFKSMHHREMTWGENAEGEIEQFFREFELRAFQAEELYGGDGKLPDEVLKWAKEQPDKKLTFLHAIWRRPGIEDASPDELIEDVTKRPWASQHFYLQKKGKGHSVHLVKDSGFYDKPRTAPRWSKTTGKVTGHGPGDMALPYAITLNEAYEMELEAWEKDIDPPMKNSTANDLAATIDWRAGATNSMPKPQDLEPMTSGNNYQVNLVKFEELREQIRDAFFSDMLELPPAEDVNMTAFETSRRIEIQQKRLGPVLGRLETTGELLGWVIQRTYRIMARFGDIEPPPQEAADSDLEAEFLGPLARAQKAEGLISIERWVGGMLAASAQRPEVLDVADLDELNRISGRMLGVPESGIRDEAKTKQVRVDRHEQELEIAQAEASANEQSQPAAA